MTEAIDKQTQCSTEVPDVIDGDTSDHIEDDFVGTYDEVSMSDCARSDWSSLPSNPT